MKPAQLSLQKNIAWNSSGSFVYLFFQWLITYLVVIVLGFKDSGIFSLAVAISSVAFTFALYGVRGYQVSDITRQHNDKSYITSRVITSLIAVVGCIIYLFIHKYSLFTTLCIIAYTVFKMSEAYVDAYHGIIQRGLRMDYIGKSFILRGVVGNILFIGTMLVTKNLFYSILALAASSFLLIFLYDRTKVKLFYEPREELSTKGAADLLIECFPLAFYSILSILVMSIPRIALENMKGTEILGIYASIAIPAAIIQVISGYIFTPLLSLFAEHVSRRNFKLFHGLLFKTVTYILLLSGIVILAGAIFGHFGLVLLFGHRISNYTYLFLPVLLISSLTALSGFIALMLTVLRDFKGLATASIVAAFICFFGSNSFIRHFDINGASFVLIFALVIQIITMCIFMMTKMASIKRSTSNN